MSIGRTPVIVLGAGGLGREVVRSLQHKDTPVTYRILGVAADDIPNPMAFDTLGVPMLGTIDDVLRSAQFMRAHFIIAIGNPVTRARLHGQLIGQNVQIATFVHPLSSISADARIGQGTFIAMGALVSQSVTIGDSVKIDQGCSLSHDVEVGNFASLAPSVTACGAVRIGERSNIGAAATLLPGIRIGADAVVGAGAVVTRDVASGITVAGVPARPLGASSP